MNWLNSNAIHNYLNIIALILGVFLSFDWTVFGLDAVTVTKLTGAFLLISNILKVTMNVSRDGVGGLVQVQPPVVDKPLT